MTSFSAHSFLLFDNKTSFGMMTVHPLRKGNGVFYCYIFGFLPSHLFLSRFLLNFLFSVLLFS
jgi:hypothetical protein